MTILRNSGLLAAAAFITACLLTAGSISAPARAQSIPYTVSCSLTLTGWQAWVDGHVHRCGVVEVETQYRTQRICNPYPGGQFCVTLYFFDLRARQLPSVGSVLVAKVDVANSPTCSFTVSGSTFSPWKQCSGANGLFPPARLVLSSVVLRY